MCRDKLEGVSAAKVCVSESACVSVIKAVYDSFTGGKSPKQVGDFNANCGSAWNISETIRLLRRPVLTL